MVISMAEDKEKKDLKKKKAKINHSLNLSAILKEILHLKAKPKIA